MSSGEQRFRELMNVPVTPGLAEAAKTLIGKEDVNLKTEIDRPVELAILSSVAGYLRQRKYPKSAKVIETFVTEYRLNMVSYKRQSRKEFIEALRAAAREERAEEDILARLTGQSRG